MNIFSFLQSPILQVWKTVIVLRFDFWRNFLLFTTLLRTARFSKKSLWSDVGEIKKIWAKFKKNSVLTPRNSQENSNTVISVIYLISLRLGFRRNFCLYLHPNLVSSPIKGILEILNFTPGAFRWIFWQIILLLVSWHRHLELRNRLYQNTSRFLITWCSFSVQ